MEKSAILGDHSIFLYYGTGHLLVNLYSYVRNSIENNRFVYLYVEQALYDGLIARLDDTQKKNLDFLPEDMFSSMHIPYESPGLKDYMNSNICSLKRQNFNGVSIIIQSGFAIQNMGFDKFMGIEACMTEAIKDSDVSILCAYDFENLITQNGHLTHDVMTNLFSEHTHQLFKFNLQKLV